MAPADSGVLVFDVKPFTSESKLKSSVERQFKTFGIEWGVADGQLVVSLVRKQLIKFALPLLTRYGESTSFELEAGTYRLTCIGYLPETGRTVDEILVSGAFFNIDIQGFGVVAGKTTTIEVHPTIQKRGPPGRTYFTPELFVRVIEGGEASGSPRSRGAAGWWA